MLSSSKHSVIFSVKTLPGLDWRWPKTNIIHPLGATYSAEKDKLRRFRLVAQSNKSCDLRSEVTPDKEHRPRKTHLSHIENLLAGIQYLMKLCNLSK